MTVSSEMRLSVKGQTVVPHVRTAARFHERFLGLMGRAPIGRGAALWLSPCGSIHTCFMRFAIDVIFLDADGKVLRIARRVRPWRLAWAPQATHSVVELESGWLPQDAIEVGARAEVG